MLQNCADKKKIVIEIPLIMLELEITPARQKIVKDEEYLFLLECLKLTEIIRAFFIIIIQS